MSIWDFLSTGKNLDFWVMPNGTVEVFDCMTTEIHFVIPAFLAQTITDLEF